MTYSDPNPPGWWYDPPEFDDDEDEEEEQESQEDTVDHDWLYEKSIQKDEQRFLDWLFK